MQTSDPQDSITITITEYNTLLEDSILLEALDAAGVRSWEGFEEAQTIYEEAKNR